MTIKAQIIDVENAAWPGVLEMASHDFYHLPEYASLSAGTQETALACIVTWREHKMLSPFLRRRTPETLFPDGGGYDVASPYGYSGPVWTAGAPAAFKRDSLQAMREVLRQQGVVTGLFRLHPFLNMIQDFEQIGDVVSHGPTVYVDLTLSEDSLTGQLRGSHRREINALTRKGFSVFIDETWDYLDQFVDCYRQTMTRVGASDYYFFSDAYFRELRKAMAGRLHLCIVTAGGVVACGGIVSLFGGLAQNHLSATADAFLRVHPSKLMIRFLESWLKAQGASRFHLGGGLGSQEDSLYRFKAGFSPLTKTFHTWRLICDADRYAALMRAWTVLNAGRQPRDANFFPGYRLPPGS